MKRVTRCWRLISGVCVLMALQTGGAWAQSINVIVNGDPVQFVGTGPQQVNGRVLVPVRGVLEKLGAVVAWKPQTQSVIASNANVDIQLRLGDRQATVNGKTVLLDVPAMAIEGHTMVPLRFLGEALGAEVKWDNATRTVRIAANGAPTTEPRHEEPRHGERPEINRFAFETEGHAEWLRAGQSIKVVLEGAPGGQASFRIPGLVHETPMTEERPGRYVGTWTAPREKPLQLAHAPVIGGLKVGDQESNLIQAADTVSVDTVAPKIHDLSPEPDSHVPSDHPSIAAAFDDQGGSDVDPNQVHLILDGRDITGDAVVTHGFITFKPTRALPPGEQNLKLLVPDRAGNVAEADWKFVCATHEADGIRSVTQNAGKTLEPGDTLHVEIMGSPGGQATFSLGNIHDIRMQEAAPGRYATDYTIRKGDDVASAPLSARLVTRDGQKYVRQADRPVTVNTGQPIKPIILSPRPDDGVTDPLVIRGKATPYAQVHVKVDYKGKLLGLLPVSGTASDSVVKANKNGEWQTDPIDIGSVNARGVEYTITATATNAADKHSDSVSLKVRAK